jgi:hypothetical protein
VLDKERDPYYEEKVLEKLLREEDKKKNKARKMVSNSNFGKGLFN